MPIVFDSREGDYVIALWRVEEDALTLCSLCRDDEVEYAMGFSSEARRAEWLSWRALLHAIRPEAVVAYNEHGAPMLTSGGYIAVSHTSGYVAVMLSDRACGLDIEFADRNFGRVASRFVNEGERSLIEDLKGADFELQGLVWCAKEAAYKCSAIAGLDFLKDIIVVGIDTSFQKLDLRVRGSDMKLKYFIFNDLIVVHTA